MIPLQKALMSMIFRLYRFWMALYYFAQASRILPVSRTGHKLISPQHCPLGTGGLLPSSQTTAGHMVSAHETEKTKKQLHV